MNGSSAASARRNLARLARRCARNHEAQALDLQLVPSAPGSVRPGAVIARSTCPRARNPHHLVRRGLTEGELDPRRRTPKSAQEIGNEPTGKRMQECQPHRTAIGIAQRGDPFGGGINLRNAAVRVFQHDLPINIRPKPTVIRVQAARPGTTRGRPVRSRADVPGLDAQATLPPRRPREPAAAQIISDPRR